MDAQGSQGSLVNRTTGTSAITTGKDVNTGENGTWQVYSASPDNNTFGTNLNSETDAQWTSKSASNKIATKNKYGNTPNSYSDTSSNKFIFQATPVITLYTDDYLKTYGDEVSADTLNKLLKGKEVFTGLDGKSHNVNDYSSAFQEDGYTKYISGEDTVTVTSDGSTATATRTGGKYEATAKSGADHKNAVYDLTVNLNDAKALDGYAIDTENGKLEIKKRSVSITSSGEQTYGDSTYTSWTDKRSGFANGDEKNFTYEHGIKSGSDYETNLNKTTGRTTADAGEYKDSVSYSNPTISGKKNVDGTNDTDFFSENYTLDTENSKGSIKVKKASLKIKTEDVTTDYGTVKETKSSVDGLTNGDKDTNLAYDYGNYGSGYSENNTKTGNVGKYGIQTSVSGSDFLKNYDITGGDATLTIKPKNIYTEVTGKGSTLSDIEWIVTKDPNSQTAYGEHVDFSYGAGEVISSADKTLGVKSFINRIPISDGTQIGNYIYHPTGIVQLTFNPIVKPDVWAHSGGYRPRNKIETSLPVFRVEDTKVGQYGTYGVEHNEEGDKLVLSATGMRLPEPDQVPDEERTFTTTLSTETGSGTFKLVYNGVSLKVYPQDKEAEETVRAGDKTKNVSLSEKALYVGYTEMGLDLIDLKGVYIYFN